MEQNVEFIQKKRDEVAFSPKDHQSVESFLQVCTIIFTASEFFFGVIFLFLLDFFGLMNEALYVFIELLLHSLKRALSMLHLLSITKVSCKRPFRGI